MMNNIILNGVNSNTIQGLIIQELPPISKPAIRTEIEEIDGRDGDVITKLGYAAYDKQLSIGLYGNYDINQVISFFNTSGTVIFSNEPDKYYNYQILNEIDFERLVRFRTAIVTMHVQPFKYSATETPQTLSGTVITGEGSNINLVNTTDSGLFTDLQKKGDTEQQTYSGKNLFDVNKPIVYTSGASGSVTDDVLTVTTTSTQYSATYLTIPIPNSDDLLGKTVTLSANMSTNGGATRLFLCGVNSNGVVVSNRGSISSSGSITITLPSTYPTNCVAWVIAFNSRLNSVGDVGSTSTYSNVMLEISPTKTNYEPYVGGSPSPNPDYPQEIKTVTGNNNVTICGKQLFDKDNANVLTGYISSTKINASNGTSTLYIPIIGGKPYTVSKISSSRFRICTTANIPVINEPVIDYATGDTSSSLTFNTSLTANYLCVFFYISTYDTLTEQEILDTIQIEEGTEATPYEPYQSQTYPINLGNIELCETNGTKDYIYKNNSTWYLHKATGKKTLNGNESGWGSYADSQTDVLGFYVPITNSVQNQGICSHLIKYDGDLGRGGRLQINYPAITITSQYIKIAFPKTLANSLSNFKTWLSTNNMDVYYLLATPTDTEITDSTLLSQLNALGNATTYLGTTNISTSGDGLSPILYVETVAVDDPVLKITNSGNTTAKPIMTLYGTGTINLSLNGEQIFVIDLSSENYVTIDVSNMEAYYNGILKNRLITGNYENFVLNQGENEITFTGTLYSLTISNYSRWI